ncbi:hypothetical protein LTR22_011138 [Elasticomyces elasticus]|nr:hypothetical protein LTR22_011138 [Elasticomyces elasticus]KAK4924132.1 hypothetical protein LTR49_008651 [Elasticomyces elasticus]KAK5758480.1 hypothetical protein LTS12_011342 [Elasticomyces elasticus]
MAASIPPKTAPITPARDGTNATRLRISLDYGTRTLASAILIVKPDVEFTTADVHTVPFGQQNHWAPQVAAYDVDGTFYWGDDVSLAINDKRLEAGDVIELWKMLLYPGHETEAIADRIYRQLGVHKLDDLLATHFREIIITVKAWLKISSPVSGDHTAELFLSVPQMWKSPGNRKMTVAAQRAGVEHVELVYEPQCAAGYFTGSIKNQHPQWLDAKQVLLVADVGGGTGDFVSFAYGGSSRDGAKVALRTVKEPEGEMCGSHFVNEEILHHVHSQAVLKVGPGGLKDLCENHLGITLAAGLSEAGECIESIKNKFSSVKADASFIFLHGAQDAELEHWVVRIDSKQIARFFEPVVQKIFACIDRQMTEETKAMIIPGGFGRSPYFLALVEARYPDLRIVGQAFDAVGAYQPIARGALYRYTNVELRGLPSTESFGIAQIENYDPKVHLDAVKLLTKAGKPRVKPTHNPAVVEKDLFDDKIKIVHNRWVSIMSKGAIKEPGQPIESEHWQLYYAFEDQKDIPQTVYWTEGDIKDHDSILEQGMGDMADGAKLRPDIQVWDELKLPLPDLAALDYKLEKTSFEPSYKIWYRLKVNIDGANVGINYQIAKPGSKLFEGDEFRPGNVVMTEDEVYEIVAASHNPFPRTSTN